MRKQFVNAQLLRIFLLAYGNGVLVWGFAVRRYWLCSFIASLNLAVFTHYGNSVIKTRTIQCYPGLQGMYIPYKSTNKS
jgi:hypothetical protein